VQAVPPEKLPGAIGEIHLFPLDDDADFESRIDALAQVLLIDRAWIREHTRLGARAGQWLAADRADDHLLGHWVDEMGLDRTDYGTHSRRRTKTTLIYRRTKNLRAVQLLLSHSKLESTVRYVATEVDDALEISEQIEF
jgi:site-specific recombinase XerC